MLLVMKIGYFRVVQALNGGCQRAFITLFNFLGLAKPAGEAAFG